MNRSLIYQLFFLLVVSMVFLPVQALTESEFLKKVQESKHKVEQEVNFDQRLKLVKSLEQFTKDELKRPNNTEDIEKLLIGFLSAISEIAEPFTKDKCADKKSTFLFHAHPALEDDKDLDELSDTNRDAYEILVSVCK